MCTHTTHIRCPHRKLLVVVDDARKVLRHFQTHAHDLHLRHAGRGTGAHSVTTVHVAVHGATQLRRHRLGEQRLLVGEVVVKRRLGASAGLDHLTDGGLGIALFSEQARGRGHVVNDVVDLVANRLAEEKRNGFQRLRRQGGNVVQLGVK